MDIDRLKEIADYVLLTAYQHDKGMFVAENLIKK